jgi:hypothetical protein
VLQVARALIDKGDIVLIADTKGVKDIYSTAGLAVEDSSTPLSVLVNGGTASAAEVVSGALQDSGRGVIVGERTFGKGLIQSVRCPTNGLSFLDWVATGPEISLAPMLLFVLASWREKDELMEPCSSVRDVSCTLRSTQACR